MPEDGTKPGHQNYKQRESSIDPKESSLFL